MNWSTSNRRSRLPSDWAKRVAKAKARAGGRCQAEQHVRDCTGVGAECDHTQRGDDHSLTNLQWLSVACHKAKTQAEATQALTARRGALHLRPEAHPGRTWAAPPPPPGRA